MALWAPGANKILQLLKSKMAAAAVLKKNWKISMFQKPLDHFWRNLVQWCTLALRIPTADEIETFLKSNMAGGRHTENRKIVISQKTFDWFHQDHWHQKARVTRLLCSTYLIVSVAFIFAFVIILISCYSNGGDSPHHLQAWIRQSHLLCDAHIYPI